MRQYLRLLPTFRARVEQAKKDVESAEQALAQAHEKHLGDYLGGDARPSDLKESYYQRVREKEEQLRAAQQHLKELEAHSDQSDFLRRRCRR